MEWKQATAEYEAMEPEQRCALLDHVTDSLLFAPEELKQSVLPFFFRISEELGKNLEKRLGF